MLPLTRELVLRLTGQQARDRRPRRSRRSGDSTCAPSRERHGTPLFVYDADEVRAGFRRIRNAFRYAPSYVHFAVVCNPNLYLLRLLRREGAKLHANTPGDVYCGLRVGYDPRDIVFSGSNLGKEDLVYVLGAGVSLNVDSLDDLRRACELAPGGDFGLRMHLLDLPESRTGVREHELDDALALARASGARVTALHVYCGTHGQSLPRYRASLDRLVALALRAPDVDCINLGGGFGHDYLDPEKGAFPFEALARAADAALRDLSKRLGRTVTLRVEPGRAIVAGAAVLLTEVRSIKREATRRYVGVDTTTANFTSPVVHGSRRRVMCIEDRPAADTLSDVCGCTTYARDFVARDVPLPEVRCRRDLLGGDGCGRLRLLHVEPLSESAAGRGGVRRCRRSAPRDAARDVRRSGGRAARAGGGGRTMRRRVTAGASGLLLAAVALGPLAAGCGGVVPVARRRGDRRRRSDGSGHPRHRVLRRPHGAVQRRPDHPCALQGLSASSMQGGRARASRLAPTSTTRRSGTRTVATSARGGRRGRSAACATSRIRGQVMEIRGCNRDVFLTCFRAHVVVRETGTVYDDVAALDCVRWAPWDPAP